MIDYIVYTDLSEEENLFDYNYLTKIIGPDELNLTRAEKGPTAIMADIIPTPPTALS